MRKVNIIPIGKKTEPSMWGPFPIRSGTSVDCEKIKKSFQKTKNNFQKKIRVDARTKARIGTTAPGNQLEITGSNGILHLGAAAWVDRGPTSAGVVVDNSTYKSLMIVGNNIAGNSGKGREVKVWDYLNVQGSISATGAVRPMAATIGNNCATYGIGFQAYDSNSGAPLYCNATNIWTAVGGGVTGTWHNLARAGGTTYTNSTGKTIFVEYLPVMPHTSFTACSFFVDGISMWTITTDVYAAVNSGIVIPVSAGSTYKGSCSTSSWQEFY